MPGPEYAGIVDVLRGLPVRLVERLPRPRRTSAPDPFAGLPADVSLAPEYADITDQLERKIMGIGLYESQIERLFDGTREMADAVRALRPGDRRARRRWTARPSATGSPAASDALTARRAATERWSRRHVVALAGVVARRRDRRSGSSCCRPRASAATSTSSSAVGPRHRGQRPRERLRPEPAPFRGRSWRYIWGVLAAVEPALPDRDRRVGSGVRALMKVAGVARRPRPGARSSRYALRDRPRWAVVGAAAILLHPAVIDVSAWWGQYESIYVLSRRWPPRPRAQRAERAGRGRSSRSRS